MKIIKFGADWCAPCKLQDDILELVSSKGYEVERIDADEHDDLVRDHKISKLPTTLVMDGDKELLRWEGLVSESVILSELRRLNELYYQSN